MPAKRSAKKSAARRPARKSNAKSRCEVIVGNVGTVYDGSSKEEAKQTYLHYVALSIEGRGRAGGESVTMIVDEDIVAEHHGADDIDDEG